MDARFCGHERSCGLELMLRHGHRRRDDLGKRAAQFGGEPVAPVYDGVTHPRSLNRWTWYRHTADLRIVR